MPPSFIRFEQDDYIVEESNVELEVCVVVEGLQENASLPVVVLIAAEPLTADGKHKFFTV